MTNETKQTAVDVFSEKVFNSIELLKRGWVNQEDFLNGLIEFRDEAKELERSQHIKTWEAGLLKVDFNDYINETYGGNK